MKKYKIARTLIIGVLMISAILTACSQNAVETNKTTTESKTVLEIGEIKSTTEKETTESESTTQKSSNSETTKRPADTKSAGQTTTKKVTTTQKSTTTQRQTTTRNQTATQKVTTTQKQTTTKRVTTTATRTTQSKKLTKSDIDWVQSQAHAYIKSKGMSVNSSVGSFSYRISSHNYTDRNKLLSEVKNTIDFEYSECINSGWKKVDMYVSVSSDGDGDYWLVVMYG